MIKEKFSSIFKSKKGERFAESMNNASESDKKHYYSLGEKPVPMEELLEHNKFARKNDLADFCKEAYLELGGRENKIPEKMYNRVVKELFDRYGDQIADKDYVQADARGLIRQLL